MAAAFAKGDKVAVSHAFAVYAGGAVLRSDALPADAKRGKVTGAANAEKTWFDVALDDGKTGTFTYDELVKVADE